MPIPKIAITAGLMVANMALTMTRKIEGPRLDDLKVMGADYGTPLPLVWGTRRIAPPIFWSEELREVKRRRKTKGGKYNEYTYYGTWAVALADHPIEAIRRIWFDTHLVLDLTGAGPVTPFSFGDLYSNLGSRGIDSAGEKFRNSHIAIYTGTETQEPDPRMQATVEAEHGEGSCPAYRGTAYAVFKDIALEKIGNRIPQVSVELVSDPSPLWVSETATTNAHFVFSPDFSLWWNPNAYDFSVWDTAARAQLASFTSATDYYGGASYGAVNNEGEMIGLTAPNSKPYKWDLSGNAMQLSATTLQNIFGFNDIDGVFHWAGDGYVPTSDAIIDDVAHDMNAILGVANANTSSFFPDLDGDIWCTASDAVSGRRFLHKFGFAGFARSFEIFETGTLVGGVHYRDDDHDQIVVRVGSTLRAYDIETGALLHTYSGTMGNPSFRHARFGQVALWCGFYEISLVDLTLIRFVSPTNWGLDGSLDDVAAIVYEPITHALLVPTFNKFLYLDRLSDGGVTLGSIVETLAERCGVVDYDFSDLDQIVPGWSQTRGPADAMIEPLLDLYDSDIRPHDFSIQGQARTGVSSGATLLTERFVDQPRYAVKVRQAAELPRVAMIDFADVDGDQQPNNARTSRPLDATGARGEQKFDLTTLALNADDAAQLLNRHFRRIWNERKEIANGLTAQELALEPGDVRTLSLDGTLLSARCVRTTLTADDRIRADWKCDAPTLATLDGSIGATFDGRIESTINVPLISKGFVLDVPYIEDSDDQSAPLAYVLAAPYATGSWPGATLYQAIDGEYSDELASVPSSAQATWGAVSATLPYANPNLWDRGTTLTVVLQTGELTGCTEAAANADPMLNLCAIGREGRWELVQFTSAVLTGTRTYTVSGLKRGRRGTEWAAETHAANDYFVLLDTAEPVAMGLSEVGTDLSFKAITEGRTEAGAFPIAVAPFAGHSLKPYAPVHVSAVKEASGDWTITWVRRTRIGGAWTSGTPIPLGEASEEYELDLGDGVTTVTKTVSSATYTWDVATQTTDTGGEVMAGDLEVTVAQTSDVVGRGTETAISA